MSVIGLVHMDPKTGTGRGSLKTLGLDFKLTFQPSGESDPQRPSHVVLANGVEIGSAWRKVGNSQRNMGETFFSVTVDDPSMSQPLHVFLFPPERQTGGAKPGPDDPVPYNVVWRRSRASEDAA